MVSGSASTPPRREDDRCCRTRRAVFEGAREGTPDLTAKEYIEPVAQELGRVRGRGLLLSPADAQLALFWHASRVPVAAVIAEVRRAERLRTRTAGVRGAAEMLVSLQAIAPIIDRLTARRPPPQPKPEGLRAQLRAAAQAPGLSARAAWESLADGAEQLPSQARANGDRDRP